MRLKMRTISYVLVLAMMLNFSSVALVYANDIALSNQKSKATEVDVKSVAIKEIEDMLAQPKENITFIKGGYDDISHLEYTYTSDGKNYKVIENTNDEFTTVESTIYIETQEGVYEKLTTQKINIDSSMVTATFEANGQISAETFSLETTQYASLEFNSIDDFPITINSSYYDSPVTDWTYWGTFNYSNRISKFTISAVTAIIVGIVSNVALPGVL